MVSKNDEILSEFYVLCGQILAATAKEEDIKRITKTMCDTKQQAVMGEEFGKIANTLKEDKKCH